MLSQGRVCPLRIPRDDRFEDAPVIVDQVGLHRRKSLDQLAARAVGMREQTGHRIVKHDQRLGSGCQDDRAMEFEIRHSAGIRLIDRFGDARQFALQPLEVGDAGALAGQPDGLAFDRDARLHDVVHHAGLLGEREGEEVIENGDIRTRDHGADAVPDLDDAEHGQRAQRFADNRPADTKLAREFALRDQAIPRLERARQQPLAQERKNLLEALFALGCSPDFHPDALLILPW